MTLVAAACLAGALKFPLWHLRMEAPQYKDEEALRVNVFAGEMRGDLHELDVLNQYIGVHLPKVLPQSIWLPRALLAAAALGIAGAALPLRIRRASLVLVSFALAGSIAFAIFQARHKMWEIGHRRDAHTKMAGVRDFTPPFLGTAKIAQFTVASSFGTGAWLIGAAVALQAGAAVLSRRESSPKRAKATPTPRAIQSFHTEAHA
jgi:hypothetical protein